MIFDLTPLTSEAFVFLGVAFIATFFLLNKLLRLSKPLLRAVSDKKGVYFGGVVLVVVTTILVYFATPNTWLSVGLSAASLLILIVGINDEIAELSPRIQFIWQAIIAALAVLFGWTIRYVSNPLGDGVIYFAPLVGGIVAVFWLLLIMNALNWLDGSDGLASGVSMIGFITLAAVSLLPSVQDRHTLTLALIGLGVSLGFLLWNFSPARVHLGTTGAWFLGLYLGLVATIGGGKIVTTILVLALPLIDFVFVIGQRLVRRQAPWQGDTEHHLHYRLKAWGVSPRLIFAAVMLFSSILGIAAVALQTTQKIIALAITIVIFALTAVPLIIFRPQNKKYD